MNIFRLITRIAYYLNYVKQKLDEIDLVLASVEALDPQKVGKLRTDVARAKAELNKL